jgi:hypothetical protein
MMCFRQKAESPERCFQASLTWPDDGSSGETERIMTILPKILLAVSVAGFAAGSIIA